MTETKNVETEPQGDSKATEVKYLEYKGDPQYGTEFLATHTIRPIDAKEAQWVTKLDKDLVFKRRESGRYKGRMLVPVSELPEGVLEELESDPAFQVVTLKG